MIEMNLKSARLELVQQIAQPAGHFFGQLFGFQIKPLRLLRLSKGRESPQRHSALHRGERFEQ